jgi:hypothetical protein
MLLQPLVKELRRTLYGQNATIQTQRPDGCKPRFERLGADVVVDDGKALFPDADVVGTHGGLQVLNRLKQAKRLGLSEEFPTPFGERKVFTNS